MATLTDTETLDEFDTSGGTYIIVIEGVAATPQIQSQGSGWVNGMTDGAVLGGWKLESFPKGKIRFNIPAGSTVTFDYG